MLLYSVNNGNPLVEGQASISALGIDFGLDPADLVLSPTNNVSDGGASLATIQSWQPSEIIFTVPVAVYGGPRWAFIRKLSGEATADGVPVTIAAVGASAFAATSAAVMARTPVLPVADTLSGATPSVATSRLPVVPGLSALTASGGLAVTQIATFLLQSALSLPGGTLGYAVAKQVTIPAATSLPATAASVLATFLQAAGLSVLSTTPTLGTDWGSGLGLAASFAAAAGLTHTSVATFLAATQLTAPASAALMAALTQLSPAAVLTALAAATAGGQLTLSLPVTMTTLAGLAGLGTTQIALAAILAAAGNLSGVAGTTVSRGSTLAATSATPPPLALLQMLATTTVTATTALVPTLTPTLLAAWAAASTPVLATAIGTFQVNRASVLAVAGTVAQFVDRLLANQNDSAYAVLSALQPLGQTLIPKATTLTTPAAIAALTSLRAVAAAILAATADHTVTPDQTFVYAVAMTLAATSALAAARTPVVPGATTLTVAAEHPGTSQATLGAQMALAAFSGMTPQTQAALVAAAALVGTGVLTTARSPQLSVAATVAATGALAATPTQLAVAAASLVASPATLAFAQLRAVALQAILATAGVADSAQPVVAASATLAAAVAQATSRTVGVSATASLAALAAASAVPHPTFAVATTHAATPSATMSTTALSLAAVTLLTSAVVALLAALPVAVADVTLTATPDVTTSPGHIYAVAWALTLVSGLTAVDRAVTTTTAQQIRIVAERVLKAAIMAETVRVN